MPFLPPHALTCVLPHAGSHRGAQNGTALMAAALSGQFSCVERLLAAGASVDASHPQCVQDAHLSAAAPAPAATAEEHRAFGQPGATSATLLGLRPFRFKMTAFLWAAYNGHLAVAER